MEDQKAQSKKQNEGLDTDDNIPKNEIQNSVSNPLNNPFLIASLTNSLMMNLSNNGPFQIQPKIFRHIILGPYGPIKQI